MLRSATSDFSRCVSASSTSASRAFRLAAPPSRNCSRQPDSCAAVTPSSRESVSRSSPRSSRSTAANLRFADQRPRPSRRSSGAPPLALRAPFGPPEAGSRSLLIHTSSCSLLHFHHNSVSKKFLGRGSRRNPRTNEESIWSYFRRIRAEEQGWLIGVRQPCCMGARASEYGGWSYRASQGYCSNQKGSLQNL